jgi:hypothetical protein
MTHGGLAQGTACDGHILLGNHEITRTNGATPVVNFYPVQTRREAKLGATIESRLRQCLRQRDATSQDMHERRNYPPPRGVIVSDPAGSRHHTTQGQA